jgi:hypothetical protein
LSDSQVVEELAASLTITWAVARLRGPTTRFSSTGKLISVSTARLVCFVAVQACRITIASALCYGGSKFIGFTISLKDLILNCIALTVRHSPAHTVHSAHAVHTQYPHSTHAVLMEYSLYPHIRTVHTLSVPFR